MKNLTLDVSSSFYTPGLYPSDALRSVAGVGVYQGFLDWLAAEYKPYDLIRHFGLQQGCDYQNQYSSDPAQNPSLFVFPYDWRQDNNQSADKLREYVQCVQQFYPPGTRIDVVAHSQGGLIARKYILQSQLRNEPHHLGKVVTIASPFLGAPEATYKLYTGGDREFPFSYAIASPENMKFLAPYFASMHQLLPSRKYQDLEGIIVAESGDVNGNGISDEIYSFGQNVSQLDADFPTASPGTVGAGFHDSPGQDDWTQDQSGIDYFHIVGEQSQLNTTYALAVKKSLQCRLTGIGLGLGGRCYNDRLYIPAKGFGDKTVPTTSALRSKTLANGQTISLTSPNSTTYYYQSLDPSNDGNSEHVKLLDNVKIRQTVAYVLGFGPKPPLDEQGGPTSLVSTKSIDQKLDGSKADSIADQAQESSKSANLNVATDRITEILGNQVPPSRDLTSVIPSFYVSLTGVPNISVTDEQGNRAFIDPETMLLTNNVAGLLGYEMIGDQSSLLSMSESHTYTLEFTSSDRSVGVEFVDGKGNKNPTAVVRWNDLNIPPGLQVRLVISNSALVNLQYDSDGDGQFETVVAPTVRVTGSSAADVNPPTVSIGIVQNGSQATATVTASDDQSGVSRIFYSTDGLNFQIYSSPVNIPYSTSPITFVAFADDNVANRSGIYTKTFLFAPINVPGLVRHGFNINGRLEGSIQQLLGENTVLNSSSSITGELLVPGIPTLVRNGSSTFGGTITGTGSNQPTNYSVTLNSSSELGHLHTRVDAVSMPTVALPPTPSGTRNVTLNSSSQSIGDFSTLRNLTLNSNAGTRQIPLGTYGNFIANSGSGFILGVAGATQPDVYNLQALTLNSGSQFQIAGPVILTLGSGMTLNGSAGTSTNPSWLQLRIASGGVTINSNGFLFGNLTAPSGVLTVNSGASLFGNFSVDRLAVNGSGKITIVN